MNHKNLGSHFDDFLQEEGLLDHAERVAAKRVLVFQLQKEMELQNLTKSTLARRMATSRSALDRLLDPEDEAITLKTLMKAADSLGKKILIRLV